MFPEITVFEISQTHNRKRLGHLRSEIAIFSLLALRSSPSQTPERKRLLSERTLLRPLKKSLSGCSHRTQIPPPSPAIARAPPFRPPHPSIRDNLDHDSNVTEESELQEEKQFSHMTSTDTGIIISIKPV
jgi:hypothetical protein